MNDVNAARDLDTPEPIPARQIDRDDYGDPWAAWDDIGGEG
jgi:hypothetical protein